ncbi:hypothetical protein Tco_0815278 [Tanacetum coccineum]
MVLASFSLWDHLAFVGLRFPATESLNEDQGKNFECLTILLWLRLRDPLSPTKKRSDGLSAQWDKCNVIVLTWIMNYVSPDVYMGIVYSVDAAFVWKELKSTYDKLDGSVVFNLLQKIISIDQGGTSIADYYHRLNSLWREFDALTKLSTCALLTRDPLHEVKDAYTTVCREESHRGILESSCMIES